MPETKRGQTYVGRARPSGQSKCIQWPRSPSLHFSQSARGPIVNRAFLCVAAAAAAATGASALPHGCCDWWWWCD